MNVNIFLKSESRFINIATARPYTQEIKNSKNGGLPCKQFYLENNFNISLRKGILILTLAFWDLRTPGQNPRFPAFRNYFSSWLVLGVYLGGYISEKYGSEKNTTKETWTTVSEITWQVINHIYLALWKSRQIPVKMLPKFHKKLGITYMKLIRHICPNF